MSLRSIPNTPIVDARGQLTPTGKKQWTEVWQAIEDGYVSNVTRLISAQYLPDSSSSALYTARPKPVRVEKLVVVNSDSSAHTVKIWYVPQGATLGNSNLVYQGSVPATSTVELTEAEGQVLNLTDAIYGMADAADVVSIMASGIQLG